MVTLMLLYDAETKLLRCSATALTKAANVRP
jgi:hypothetical protein